MLRRGILVIIFMIIISACGQTFDAVNQQEEIASAEESTKPTEEKQSQTKSDDNQEHHLTNLKVHYIDAGQGDATLFQYADNGTTYTILYDTGDHNKKDVINYLDKEHISTIDLMVVSHPHADHMGQLPDIMEMYDVKEVWFAGNTASTKAFQQAAEAVLASDATYYEPRAGDVFDVGPLSLEVIHPSKLTGNLNEDSIAIRFTYGEVAFLFTGDAHQEEEQMMMKEASSVKAQILKLGHHGSNHSSDPSFIKSVNPDVAIYSAAKNSDRYPHEKVVSLMKNLAIKLYGTDVHGTVIITTDGHTYNVNTTKKGTISKKHE